jgi:hypothetical protein
MFFLQIVVRVRPVLPHEATQQVAVTCSSDGSSVQVMLPEREFSKPAIAASSKPDAKAYEFDACLTGSTTQVSPAGLCWHSSSLLRSVLDLCNSAPAQTSQLQSKQPHGCTEKSAMIAS